MFDTVPAGSDINRRVGAPSWMSSKSDGDRRAEQDTTQNDADGDGIINTAEGSYHLLFANRVKRRLLLYWATAEGERPADGIGKLCPPLEAPTSPPGRYLDIVWFATLGQNYQR